jgi:hypothetical protein
VLASVEQAAMIRRKTVENSKVFRELFQHSQATTLLDWLCIALPQCKTGCGGDSLTKKQEKQREMCNKNVGKGMISEDGTVEWCPIQLYDP